MTFNKRKMKYPLLILFAFFFQIAFVEAQVNFVTLGEPTPKYGCPNSTHSITIGATNNSPISVSPGNPITATVTIKDNSNTNTLGTTTQTITTGFASGETIYVTIPTVVFAGPMTCNVIGNALFTLPFVGAQNYSFTGDYTVKYPPTLVISENPVGSILVREALNGYSVRYYANADYGTVIKETTFSNYEPTVEATYTAKAYDPISTCISQDPSNPIQIVKKLPTGVNGVLQATISTYPNPASEYVIVKVENTNASEAVGTLTDAMGAEITRVNFYQGSNSLEANIPVQALTAGVYVLRIQSDKGMTSTKIFIK